MTAWRHLPLRARLVILFSALLTIALVAVGSLALTLLRTSLVREVDMQLDRAAQGMVDRAFAGAQGLRSPEDGPLPTDYAVVISTPDGQEVQRCVRNTCEFPTAAGSGTTTGADDGATGGGTTAADDIGGPRVGTLDVASASERAGEPYTVDGADGTAWRVTVAPLKNAQGVVSGTAAVGLPLTAVNATMGMMAGALLAIGGGVLALTAVATYAVVRSSMRPLRRIEATAAAIAAGDLSRRVDDAPASTEVGSLAASLNTMLGQVEHSFTAQRASEARMKAFVGDASHELRTPLATVTGYTELYRLGGIPPEELPGVMQRIEGSSVRMTALVTDLLSLARLDEGAPLDVGAVDVHVPLEDAARDLRVLDPSRDVTVVVAGGASGAGGGGGGGSGGVRPVAADDGALRQILTNLVGNASAYTPPGSPVELVAREADAGVLLSVVDHGPGVPEAERARIFERFARLDAGRSRDAGGSGLGLSIVAALATALGGWVRCVETPGGGATMQVWLPAAAAS
ncbi:sensor histidine kinase [Litorihabitans aurantiacus]|uniref:histidine kinase n=1 Tax=Litorihabitans aurantiacus TaxID=1930061 RepID=A0AA37XCV6_9MICO|nr:HAMP domain-containing sensor histidine kinase [Litorihabitans aurantiacus]GMA30360.1 two-component sensor histidine kinase [Litorihabitans aurantiacus]